MKIFSKLKLFNNIYLSIYRSIYLSIIIIIITPLRVFHTSVSKLFSPGFWVTTSLLKSPGLFSVFWSILRTLLSVWSPIVLWFLSLPVPLPVFSELARSHILLLVSPSSSCSIIFLRSLARSKYSSLFTFFLLSFCSMPVHN